MGELEALGIGLEGVPVPAVLSDLVTGVAIGANAAAVDLLGMPAHELIGSDVISLVHPEERTAASSGVDALASGAVDAFQVRNRRMLRPEGAAVAVNVSGRRLESEARRLALWVIVPVEQEIDVGQVAGDEVVLAVTDHDWQLEYVSVGARLLGTASQALVGTSLLGIVHPSAAADFLDAASRAVTHRITVSTATQLRSERDVWTERQCLIVPMCTHDPPRLGIVVAAIPPTPGRTAPEVIDAHIRRTAVDARSAESLGTLAAMTARPGFPELSARQVEILSRVVRGDAVDNIATALYLSPSTVRNHLTALYRKFDVHSRAGLLAELLRSSMPNP